MTRTEHTHKYSPLFNKNNLSPQSSFYTKISTALMLIHKYAQINTNKRECILDQSRKTRI